jgi:hypothetical protein
MKTASTARQPCAGSYDKNSMKESNLMLTREEFGKQPLQYVGGMSGAWGAQRMYRNNQLGIQREVVTKRKRYDDVHGGWEEGDVSYFLDGDKREFKTVDELYDAWVQKSPALEGK